MCEAYVYAQGSARPCPRTRGGVDRYCELHADALYRVLGSRREKRFELDAARLYASARSKLAEDVEERRRMEAAGRALSAAPTLLSPDEVRRLSALPTLHAPTVLAAKARGLGYLTPDQLKEIASSKSDRAAAAALLRIQNEVEDDVTQALYCRYLSPSGRSGRSERSGRSGRSERSERSGRSERSASARSTGSTGSARSSGDEALADGS